MTMKETFNKDRNRNYTQLKKCKNPTSYKFMFIHVLEINL